MKYVKRNYKKDSLILTGALCLMLAGCGIGSTSDFANDLPEDIPPAQVSEGAFSSDASQRSEGSLPSGNTSDGSSQADSASDNGSPAGSISADASQSPADSEIISGEADAKPEPTPQPTPEITLLMVGDILLHTPVAESGLQENGSYDFTAVFAHTKDDILEADLALVNQEVILGGTELGISGYPAFNAPYELGDALVDSGFDVVLHATNHALDKGGKGIINCLNFWENSYPQIAVLGIHDSAEGQNEIYVYEQEGIRIAILNYTYGTNGIPLPQGMDYAVDQLLDLDRIAEDLKRAEEMADFTVVCPHWGTEYRLTQDTNQELLAQFFWENGADLVLGTHPHVIEPVAWVAADGIQTCDLEEQDGFLKGTDIRDGMLVYYSLGNFVNWTSGTGEGVANRMTGGMAKVTLELDEDGNVTIKEYGVEPVICHVEEGRNGVTVYPISDYTEQLAEKNAIRLQDGNFSLEYCHSLLEKVW